MGISVFPNLSNAACDVQTSNIISLSFGPNAAWYERPAGLPAPAFFNNLMHSSYFAADIAAEEKYIPIAMSTSLFLATQHRRTGGWSCSLYGRSHSQVPLLRSGKEWTTRKQEVGRFRVG